MDDKVIEEDTIRVKPDDIVRVNEADGSGDEVPSRKEETVSGLTHGKRDYKEENYGNIRIKGTQTERLN